MIYSSLDGFKISKIGVGGFNRFKIPELTLKKAREFMVFATEGGINFIDFGKEYDEKFISKYTEKFRKKIYFIARSASDVKREMEKDIENTIKTIKTKPLVYEIVVESEEELKKKIENEVLEALKKAKSENKIHFTGIFSHKAEVLRKAIKSGEFDVVSTIYNAVHRKVEELFPLKKKYNFFFIAVAPFATGILVDPKYDENVRVEGSEYMNIENALKFVLSCKYIDAVVVGTKKAEHIEEIVKIGSKKWELTERQRNVISRRMEKFLGKNFCRMCRYCEDIFSFSLADLLKLLIIWDRYSYKNFVKWYINKFLTKELMELDEDKIKRAETICPYNLNIKKMIEKIREIAYENTDF